MNDINGVPYDHVGVFSEGMYVVRKGEQYFHVREDGKPAYTQRYSHVGPFYDGFAVVCKDGRRFFHILNNGSPAYRRFFSKAGPLIRGRAAVTTPDGKDIYINTAGIQIA